MTQTATQSEKHPALDYAEQRSWRVFSIPPRSKKPQLKNWPERATNDLATIQGWLGAHPGCNWGLATGSGSGVFVVDADSEEARQELDTLGSLPKTYTVKTARGYHFYFKFLAGTEIRNSASKIAKGVDVRGEGGYVLVPPSIHPSGAVYTVLHDAPVAAAPKWLLKKLTSSAAPSVQPVAAAATLDIPEGRRNETFTKEAGRLRRAGCDPDDIERVLLKRNAKLKSPLPEKEISVIARNIGQKPVPADEAEDGNLFIGSDPIATLVTKADAVFAAMPQEQLFKRPISGEIVHVVKYGSAPEDKSVQFRDPHASILVAADATSLRDILSSSGKVFRYDRKGVPIPADPPRDITETLLSRVRTSPQKVILPTLLMLSNAPILSPHLRIICDSGFHAESGIYITAQNGKFQDPDPDERLTAKQCRALWERDFDPCFCKIPYPKEEDKAVVKSGALSVAVRNLLPTVPAHCITGPVQGSGKSLTVQLIGILTTGSLPTAVSYDGADEFGKLLLPLLAKGERLINVDNVTPTINNHRLAMGLSQKGQLSWRVLGKSEDRTVENYAVFFFNGNNLLLTGEMPRRAVIARIEPDCEHPEDRRFPFEPISRAHDFHSRAAISLLRIVRAHARAGFPGLKMLQGDAGGFSEWSRWVRGALPWMGYADPWTSQSAIRECDPGRASDEELVVMVQKAIGDRECTVREIRDRLDAVDLSRFLELTDHKPAESFSEVRVGQYFGRMRDRWFNGYRIVWGASKVSPRKWRVEMRPEQREARRVEEESI